jgi:hypothetical protein
MARTITQIAGSKTGLKSPEEEPADYQYHLFGDDLSTSSPVTGSEPPPDLEEAAGIPAPNNRSRTRTPHLKEPPTRTGEEDKAMEEEDPHDGDSLSEYDEGFLEGESSYGDDPQFSGPPNLQRLVCLRQEHCQCPCCMKNKDDVKVASICGRKVKDCQLHGNRQLGVDTYQYNFGPTHLSLWLAVSRDMDWPVDPTTLMPKSESSKLRK